MEYSSALVRYGFALSALALACSQDNERGSTTSAGGAEGPSGGSSAASGGSSAGGASSGGGLSASGGASGAQSSGGGSSGSANQPSGAGQAGAAQAGAAQAGAAQGGNGQGGAVGQIPRPNPILSRGAMTCAKTATGNATVNSGGAVVDGVYHNGGWSGGSPSPQDPAWVAVRVTGAPSRVLFIWDDGGTYKYRTPTTALVYGFPAAYHIDVSSDSTDGCDGTWSPVATVDDNAFRTRAHSFDFTGKTWVKMVMTQQPVNQSPNNIQIGEIDVHDISATGTALPDDTWFFMGDSITALGYDRAPAHQPSFAALIHTASSAYMPALINGGIGGETSADGLARLSEMLALNPDFRYFALGYGTNDAVGNQVSTSAFRSNMQSIITQLKNAGRVPILARIPYSGDGGHDTVPDFNQVIDSLASTNGLRSGPDLYAWFMTHTDQFMSDKLHPNDVGLAAMNQLWATTMRPLYP